MQHKQSVVTKCKFTKEWTNPAGQTVYYHDLVMENGDVGHCGTMEKYSEKIKEGAMITYTLDDAKKIKIVTDFGQQKAFAKPQRNGQGGNKQEQFLGYAWSYAKDLIIAGKTMKDVGELNAVARYIYDEIGKQLNGQ